MARSAGNSKSEADVWKGLAAGVVAGLAASWVMNQFQAAWASYAEGIEKGHGAQSLKPSGGQRAVEEMRVAERNTPEHEDATERIASAISENVFHRHLTKDEKEAAGTAIHYAYGAAMGGLYGVAAELAPVVSSGAGLPFGAVFWLVADEMVVPLLGLAAEPEEYPASTHAYTLCSHLVYAVTAEAVRRTLRNV